VLFLKHKKTGGLMGDIVFINCDGGHSQIGEGDNGGITLLI
jgi:hypothetical protein